MEPINYQLRTMSQKELCKAYKISRPTLKKWLSAVPGLQFAPYKRYFLPNELALIVEVYGPLK